MIYSLAYLTAQGLTPAKAIHIAHSVGYQKVGIRPLPVAQGAICYPLHQDKAMMKDTLKAMQETGVGIADLEIVRINETFQPHEYKSFFAAGEQLAATNVLIAIDDYNSNRVIDNYSKLCELAKPHGLCLDIEPMPWTACPNVKHATYLATQSKASNAGILIDALHFERSASTYDDLRAIPPELLHYAQICDAPTPAPKTLQGLLFTAREARLLPAEGGIDLVSLFKNLPPNLIISVELPNDIRYKEHGALEWAKLCLEATKKVINTP